LPDITSSHQTTNFTGKTTASQEISGSITTPISATNNPISATNTHLPATVTETSNADAAYEDSILCEGWLLGMMGISSAASLVFLTSLILSFKKPKK
jgi:ammonia channel protein AmtB